MKPIDRLLFAQGGLCFFCQEPLSRTDASIEHLVATANGGTNALDNCVACCKALNALLGRMGIKEKIRVILNQRGQFKCPRELGGVQTGPADSQAGLEKLALIVLHLHKCGSARPRTLKTLTNTINALFQKQLTEAEIESLLNKLKCDGIIAVEGTKVSYELPSGAT